MARNLTFRPAAEDYLIDIYVHIAEASGSPDRAAGYIGRIREWCDILKTFPETGRRRDDIAPGLRILGFEKRVIIAYKILPSGDADIGRIFYGGRDYEAIMGAEGDAPLD